MKKRILLVILAILLITSGWFGYHHYVAPTRIAFVNYMDFMYDAVLQANDNAFIKTEQIPFETDTFKNVGKYDAMYLFAHGRVNLSPEQKAQIQTAIEKGTAIIYRSPISKLELKGLDPEDIKYVTDCLSNGGENNYRRMLNYTRRIFDRKRLFVDAVTEPFILPDNYYYHLGDEEVFGEFENYVQFLKDTGKYNADGKNICLLATQFGASSDTGFINQLVNGFEKQGHNVFPLVSYGKVRLDYVKKTNPDMVVFAPHGKFSGEAGVQWLKEQNIPLFCPIIVFGPEQEWLESKQGMDGGMLSQAITMPEIDGGIVPFTIGAQFENERGLYVFGGIKNRIQTFLSLTEKWLALKDMPNADKKVAIFYYKEAGKNSMVAEGLELAPSILNLLERLKQEGYATGELPETPEALVQVIQQKGPVFGSYAEGAISNFMESGNPVMMDSESFQRMLDENLDETLIEALNKQYGAAPGDFMTVNEEGGKSLMIPRVDFGNVVLLPVPPAGLGDDEVKLVHGVPTPPPYGYVGAYLWARTQFKADAIVHFGTHGSVEFTPAKQVALSDRDWPDALLAGTPHFYLYVISNIGEAMIAKRRSYAVMSTHLTAPLMESDIYGPIKELDDQLERFWNTEQPMMKQEYRKSIHQLVIDSDLDKDMEFEFPQGTLINDHQLNHLHHYLHVLEQEKVTKGLHVLGEDYQSVEIEETLRLMVLDSLVFNKMKMDIARGIVTETECKDAHFMENHYREPATEIIESVLAGSVDPLSYLSSEQVDALSVAEKPQEKKEGMPAGMMKGNTGHGAAEKTEQSAVEPTASEEAWLYALKGYRDTLISIRRYEQALIDSPTLEMDALINSLNGGYTAPQSGGDPAFNPEAVPTGRNLYSINAQKTPSKEAFNVAKKLVNTLLENQLAKTGKYPEKVAFSLWSSEFIRQEGITIAQILYFLGVEPVRNQRGTVHDVKLIPLEELGRPRIDVVVQTSGQFRDLAASRIYLINRAVKLAAEAQEEEIFANFVNQGVKDAEALMKEKGIAPAEARELSSIRVFGGLNGSYGAGIMGLVENGDHWESEDEIAERYLMSMGAMYGEKVWGDYKPGAFEAALQNASMVIHPRSSNTWGALSLDHVYEFMGGISNVIRYVTGNDPDAWFSDLRNPNNPQVQTLEDAIWTEARTTVLNPKYIKGMQEEGPTAAGTFAETFRNTYAWDVMKSSAIDEELWDNLNEVYIDDIYDLGMEAYFREKNPYALQEMTAVMLEVVRKGYWKPDDEVIRKIANMHAQFVKDYEAGCSGFVCNNAKLREMIAAQLDPELRESFLEEIEAVRTATTKEVVKGVELKKEENTKQDQKTHRQEDADESSSPYKLLLLVGFAVLIIIAGLRMGKKKRL